MYSPRRGILWCFLNLLGKQLVHEVKKGVRKIWKKNKNIAKTTKLHATSQYRFGVVYTSFPPAPAVLHLEMIWVEISVILPNERLRTWWKSYFLLRFVFRTWCCCRWKIPSKREEDVFNIECPSDERTRTSKKAKPFVWAAQEQTGRTQNEFKISNKSKKHEADIRNTKLSWRKWKIDL